MARASNLMIGSLTLALIAGSFGGFLTYQKFVSNKQKTPFRVIFEGSASGLRKGASVNFAGVRVGEVVSLKLDNPRRVIVLTMIDGNTPVRKDTQVGLEFQGLTGIAAVSFTGGTAEDPPLGADGVPELTADPDGVLDVPERLRNTLRSVDKVIAEHEEGVKSTLLGFEVFTSSLSGSGERIAGVIASAESGIGSADDALAKTQDFLKSLASDKYGGELLPTVISLRELIQSFDKKTDATLNDARKMLNDLSQSVNSSRFAPPRVRR